VPLSRDEILLPVEGPYNLQKTVSLLLFGGDPSRSWSDGVFWYAGRWDGAPATLRAVQRPEGVHVAAWGLGRTAALEGVRELLGLHDAPWEFRPRNAFVRELQGRAPGMRMPRTRHVTVAVLKATLGQLVTTREAAGAWRSLVRAHGAAAPGPGPVRLPPDPAQLAQVHPDRLSPLGMLRKQAETLVRVCRVADRLEAAADLPLGPAMQRVMSVRGVGPWTAGTALAESAGFPDAVVLGDLHLARLVGRCLAGDADADDRRMMALLEPFRGHRYRVVRLLHTAGIKPPRRGPLVDAPHPWRGPR